MPPRAGRPRAIAHDGTAIDYAVVGKGKRFLFLGPGAGPTASTNQALLAPWLEAFGRDYRLILIDYPGEPKMYTLTPAAVARDYLAVADAAGAGRFAYYGFSWGAATGLQLALRTDRLSALVAGGFPMLAGPYAPMLRICRAMETGPTRMGEFEVPWLPENARQFVTYYEGLRSFDDRAAQARLACPRLCFIGTADDIPLNGEVVTRMGQTVQDHETELRGFGWDVTLLEGLNHAGAQYPDVTIPVLSDWLRRRDRETAP